MQSDPEDPLDVLRDVSTNISHTQTLRPSLPNTPCRTRHQAGQGYSSVGRNSRTRRPGSSRMNPELSFIPAMGGREGKVWFLSGVSEDMGLPNF